MKKLLRSGKVEINATTRRNATSLYVSSQKGHLVSNESMFSTSKNIVKALLKFGADSSIPFHNGYTPLHAAVCSGHVKVVKLLLKLGAGVTAYDNEGNTPYDLIDQQVKEEKIRNKLKRIFETQVSALEE